MKLYYAPGACSLADHIALAETGHDYDLAKVDLKAKQVEGGGDYLAVNPKGYVPALELDDGTVLTENIAILSYVAEQSAVDLEPRSGMAHLRALEWLAFISTELHKSFKPFFNPAASQAEKDEATKTLATRFDYVSERLGERDFLLEDFSVADCYMFVVLNWAGKNELALPANLSTYFARLQERPAVRKALQEEGLA